MRSILPEKTSRHDDTDDNAVGQEVVVASAGVWGGEQAECIRVRCDTRPSHQSPVAPLAQPVANQPGER